MPTYLPAERVRFLLEDEGPVVTLTDTTCDLEGSWRVLNRPMLLVVDGPGDEGFLLQRRPNDQTDLAPEGWDEAVHEFGGVIVDVPAVPGRLKAHLIPA